ncbi:hypothetical protein ACVWZK_009295 [Bradyrhizobium sp. GM0.4]
MKRAQNSSIAVQPVEMRAVSSAAATSHIAGCGMRRVSFVTTKKIGRR